MTLAVSPPGSMPRAVPAFHPLISTYIIHPPYKTTTIAYHVHTHPYSHIHTHPHTYSSTHIRRIYNETMTDPDIDSTSLSASSIERGNSLEKHLQLRPEPQDLRERHILVGDEVAPYVPPLLPVYRLRLRSYTYSVCV